MYISEYFPPEIGAGSNRAYELSLNWIKMGAKVTVITGFPDYPNGVIPEEYRGYKFFRETIDGIQVIRTYTLPAPNKGVFKRIISFLSFMFSSIIQGTQSSGNQDVVISTSPPFLVGISGFIISKLKRKPFVFEVRDLWPESIVQLGLINNKFIIWILEKIEIFLYKKASLIVPVAESSVKILENKGIDISKIKVIKNGVDLEFFKPIEKNIQLREQLDVGDKFLVTYLGTLGLSHALDKVIDAAKILEPYNNINFLFVGDGAEKSKLMERVENLKITNITFHESVTKKKIIKFYSISDVMLVPLKNLELFKKVIPSKIFEIMAMSKPIIISVDGEAKKIVENAEAGLFAEPENANDLAEKIKLIYENQSLRDSFANNGRKYVEKNYDRQKLAKAYLENLHLIVKPNSP